MDDYVRAPIVRIAALVSGRVQAVGYRAACAERAHSLGLSGSATNLPDGRVEVHVQGPEPDVEHFLAFLWQGPERSLVTSVERSEEPLKDAGGFSIG